MPPTLKALLATRLDQLDEAERKVLERGSVEGEIFHRGAVQALAPEETQVTTRLAGLVRRELIRPDRTQLAGDDGYRFRHLLIRDAAYDALPKAVRADLHARFAAWLDEHGHALVERDEIVGYHLEQSARYQAELGQPDPALAERAAVRLATSGRRASDRQDLGTASALLNRAAELLRPHRIDVTLELEAAWVDSDIDPHAAAQAAEAVSERAEATGDRSGAMLGRALALLNRMVGGEVVGVDEQVELCRAALPLEEERGDPRRLALLWEMLGIAANFRMQNDDNVHASQQALRYRRLAGDSPSDTGIEWALILGPRPADEAMRMLDELAAWRPPGSQDLPRAALLAMLGRSDEAWPLAEARSSHLQEVTGNTAQEGHLYLWLIATIEGDRERACRHNADMIEVISSERQRRRRVPVVSGARPLLSRSLRGVRVVPSAGAGRPAPRLRPSDGPLRRGAPPGCARRARAGGGAGAHGSRQGGDRDGQRLVPGLDVRRPRHRARARRPDRRGAQGTRAIALALWERKRCLPYAGRLREQIDSLSR